MPKDSYTYGETKTEPKIIEQKVTGTPVYTYYRINEDGTETQLDSAPTTAGTYRLVVTISMASTAGIQTAEAITDTTYFQILKAVPTVGTSPIASDLKYGQTLADSKLTGGEALVNSKAIDGTFSWDGGTTTKPGIGMIKCAVIFTPVDTDNIETVKIQVSVTIGKRDVTKPAKPTLISNTDTGIAVQSVTGQEYSIDNGENWQTSGAFGGLTVGMEYNIMTRIAETTTTTVSDASAALVVKAGAVLGDIDGDGKINASDALQALRHSVQEITLEKSPFTRGDVTRDDKINESDALQILRYSVREIDQF